MKKTIGHSDPPNYIPLVNMIINLWSTQGSAPSAANTGVNNFTAIPSGITSKDVLTSEHIEAIEC